MASDQDSVVSENENADKNQPAKNLIAEIDSDNNQSMADACWTECTHGITPDYHCDQIEKGAVTDDKQLRTTIELKIQPEFDQKDSANMSTEKDLSGPPSGKCNL